VGASYGLSLALSRSLGMGGIVAAEHSISRVAISSRSGTFCPEKVSVPVKWAEC
jgi:hypothetical protein